MKKLFATIALALVSISTPVLSAEPEKEEGFVTIFDGKSLDGWKINENPESWTLKDGELVGKGKRSHIFYVGDSKPFKNFELRVDVMTEKNSNGGIYFHTKFQETGWPSNGFEAQVNNSQGDYKRTGSLYNVVNVIDAPAKDNEWFTETVIVKGNTIRVKINEKTLFEYSEPADLKPGKPVTNKIDEGTFALQAHDPGSTVHFKNIRVKRLD